MFLFWVPGYCDYGVTLDCCLLGGLGCSTGLGLVGARTRCGICKSPNIE